MQYKQTCTKGMQCDLNLLPILLFHGLNSGFRPHLRFFIVLNLGLFVNRDDSFRGRGLSYKPNNQRRRWYWECEYINKTCLSNRYSITDHSKGCYDMVLMSYFNNQWQIFLLKGNFYFIVNSIEKFMWVFIYQECNSF